ncbi:hypothetical protein PNEG_02771 [Pneumocystis murina B123]|uniref:C2H2-type domain-containing protein n=1 Tax=Pneumocystis murina (strain B123) TaxID=1069680 RepID=M7P548_PNEMU|nr:hypothetical protein PNEG_02771 [Pneumocystis murina B123]EMR08995.1 hypothetical protein PNEG_02771 [Pneumocystis murina B123]
MVSKGIYENSTEPNFRRTWDLAEYAQKAADREEREKKEARIRWEKKHGKFKREATPPDVKIVEARDKLNLEENLNKTILVPYGASTGRQGKGVGYYCEACNETYKDSNSWIDHLNSKQHLRATNQTLRQKRVTLEDVRKRLAWLRKKTVDEKKHSEFSLSQRISEKQAIEEEERKERKEKKKMRRKEKVSHVKK